MLLYRLCASEVGVERLPGFYVAISINIHAYSYMPGHAQLLWKYLIHTRTRRYTIQGTVYSEIELPYVSKGEFSGIDLGGKRVTLVMIRLSIPLLYPCVCG